MTRGKTHPYLIVFALWLLVFASSSQTMIISPILPQVRVELGIAEAALGTLVSVYSLMLGIFAVLSGPVSDTFGRRRMLLMGTGTMTVALVLHWFVAGYLSFLALRTFAGVAGGMLSGVAVSYVGDYFPYNRRGWAIGWIMSGSAFGQIIGIPLGVLLAGELGFRTPFIVFALAMGLTFLLIWAKIPQPDVALSMERLTVRGAVRRYVEIIRRPGVVPGAVSYFLMFLGVGLYVVYLPTWLEQSMGATARDIASLFFLAGFANVLAGPQAGALSDRIGRKVVVILSSAGLSVVMLTTTVVVRQMWVAYPLFFAMMVLVAMRLSPFSALLTALVEDDRRGSLMSLAVALGHVGFSLGAGVSGLLYADVGYRSNTAIGAASVLLMAVIVWRLIPEPRGTGAAAVLAAAVPSTTALETAVPGRAPAAGRRPEEGHGRGAP
ncbi:MAG: MFS transporter [Gemmatimonadetes bacterium]|nr:MFS transporter [Gemmatimonadota bacterium]